MGRLLVSLGLAFLLYGRTLGYPLIRPVESTADWLGPTPLVEGVWLLGAALGDGSDWGHRVLQVVLLGLLVWVASSAMPRGMRRTLVMLLIVSQPMLLGAVLDPTHAGELLLAVAGTLALTSRGRWAGAWTLVALAAHPVATLVPVLARFMPRAESGDGRKVPWRVIAVVLWWGSRVAISGLAALGDAGSWTGALAEAGARVVMYGGQLILPVGPLFARTLPSVSEAGVAIGWGVCVAVILLGAWAARRVKEEGPGLMASVLLVLLPLLVSSGVGDGAAMYSEARLAWPVVGLAWLLACAAPLRMAAFALVPLCLGVTGIRAGDHASAAQLWERVHTALPDDPMARMALGNALVGTDPERAVGLLEQAVQEAGEPEARGKVRRVLIDAYVDLDRPAEARPHLAVLADPAAEGSEQDLLLRCRLAAELGDAVWEEELAPITEICRAAVERSPEDLDRLVAAAVVATGAGLPRDGRDYLIRAVELAPESTRLRQLLSNMPLSDEAWNTSGPTTESADQ